jgi:hypothetical protein
MAKSVEEVARTSDQGAVVAGQALASAKLGAAAVDDTINGMKRNHDRVRETAKRIRRLGESSRQIGEITALIDDIADRHGFSMRITKARKDENTKKRPGNVIILLSPPFRVFVLSCFRDSH